MTEENSSSPETEQEIVASHGYGQQLGRILDAVNEVIAERPAGAPDAQSIRDFREPRQDVDEIKVRSEVKRVEQAIVDLTKMKLDICGEPKPVSPVRPQSRMPDHVKSPQFRPF